MRFAPFLNVFLVSLAGMAGAVNVPPEIIQQADPAFLRRGGTVQTLDMLPLFRDPDAIENRVRLSVRIGSQIKTVDIELFDTTKPITSANFIAYIHAGATENNIIHRSIPGFVVQGGGFRWTSSGVDDVPTFPGIQNEPGISNLRGTIAMAKLAGNPNSATSQWFVNLADNSANLDAQNGGFTVFAQVLGNGMDVIDEIAALPRVNAGDAFTDLPLKDFSGTVINRVHTVETSLAHKFTYSATTDDGALVGIGLLGKSFGLFPPADRSGSTAVHLTATDFDGASVTMDIPVTVLARSQGWHVETGTGGSTTLVFNPNDSGTVAGDSTPAAWGDAAITEPVARTFTIRNDSAAPLNGILVSVSGTNAADFAITSGAGPTDIPAGGSATFTATLTPSSVGAKTARFRVGSANPNEASIDILAAATGVDFPAPIITGASPLALEPDGSGLATMPDLRGVSVTAADPRGITTFTQSPAPGTPLNLGSYSLVFTAVNSKSKTTTVNTSVTVRYDVTGVEVNPPNAATGTSAPGGTSGVFADFGVPALSDRRGMVARVTLLNGRTKTAAVYAEDGAGAGSIVAKQGDASGVPLASFKSFGDPLISPIGKITFGAKLSGVKGTEDEGVWTDLFGSLSPVLREGQPLPGLSPLRLKSVTSMSVTDDAVIALVRLLPLPGVVSSANDTALVRVTGANSAVLLARTGTPVSNSIVKKITVLQPAPASAGQGRWHGTTEVLAKLTLADKRVILVKLGPSGTLTTLLQTNSASSGIAAALGSLGIPAYGSPGIAVLGTKLPQPGITKANDVALLRSLDGATFTELLGESILPEGFSAFSDPVMNSAGGVLFLGTRRAALAGNPPINGLWFASTPGTAQSIAAIGSVAVDSDGTLLADTVWSKFTTFALPESMGPVFVAEVKGRAVSAKTKTGLWAVDSHGTTRQLLRTGQTIGAKQLTSFTLLNALPGSFGARRSYNGTGSVAVLATFSDRTKALLRIDLP